MQWTIERDEAGMNLRDYLQERRGFSRRILILAKSDAGRILVNNEEVTVRKKLAEGDKVEVQLPREKISPWLVPESIPIDIIYEDNSVLVLNKERGMATMTSPKHKSQTLSNAILGHYKKNGNENTVHVVTRLDRDTSGIVLIAKDRLTHSLLAKSQQLFAIKRKYTAIVHGSMETSEGTITAPIGRKAGSIIERTVTDSGKSAITHYKVIKRWKDYTLVEMELETGRTHQIRVHFSHINHPIVGDDLYGGERLTFRGQALHCHLITFPDVYTKKEKTFVKELPNDMQDFIAE